MKKLASILATTAGIFLGINGYSQKVIKQNSYYENGKEVTHYYYENGAESFVYDEKVDKKNGNGEYFKDSKGNIYHRTYRFKSPKKEARTENYQRKIQTNSYTQKKVYNDNYSNSNNVSLEDKVVIGAAILGGTIWLINKLSNSRRENYNSGESGETNTDYSFNVKKNNDPDNFWNEKEENNSNIWGEDEKDNKDTINFWGEKKNEIYNFKKDFNSAMKGDKKVYIKYLKPIAEKVAKNAVDEKIPGGDMIYEVVKNGPNDFWLRKVKDSERISGEFKDKKDETAGGIEMIIDDFTGNYRKKVYDITESSLKFWGDVKGEKIKKKYGEDSKEYLNYEMYGTISEPTSY